MAVVGGTRRFILAVVNESFSSFMSQLTGPLRFWAVPVGLVLLGLVLVGFNELGVPVIHDLFLTATFAALYITTPFVIFAGLFGMYFRYLAWRE